MTWSADKAPSPFWRGLDALQSPENDHVPIKSGVKQGCVLAPTLFGIFFSLLLSHAFKQSNDGTYLHTRSNGKLYNLARLRAMTKVRRVLIREMLFADDTALTSHAEDALQRLIGRFASTCREFGLTTSLKKTKVMGQDVSSAPNISIGDYTLEVVDEFVYLGSTVSSNLSVDTKLNARIGKASTTMALLATRVWDNSMLTTDTKMKVYMYQACVLSTLLYSSETWTLYSHQESRLNSFHLRCLRQMLGISWQDHVPNKQVLDQAGIQSVFAILSQKCLRWLGHVRRMQDGRISKDILYGELATGSRPGGRPVLRYKIVCKQDMKTGNINPADWEATAADHSNWRLAVRVGIQTSELNRVEQWEEKRQRRRQRVASASTEPGAVYTCSNCNKACHSRIGLYSPGGYFLVKDYWGCAAGWGHIFTFGLTIMGLHF